MSSKRTFSTALLIGAMSVGAGAAVLTSPTDAIAGDKCEGKNLGAFPDLKAACDSGGKDAAKKYMQGLKKKAKDKKAFKCSNCHEDTKTYKSKSNAVGDLKKFLKDGMK